MKRFYSLLSIFDEKFALGIDGNSASFSITHFNKGQKKGDQTSSFASFATHSFRHSLSFPESEEMHAKAKRERRTRTIKNEVLTNRPESCARGARTL